MRMFVRPDRVAPPPESAKIDSGSYAAAKVGGGSESAFALLRMEVRGGAEPWAFGFSRICWSRLIQSRVYGFSFLPDQSGIPGDKQGC